MNRDIPFSGSWCMWYHYDTTRWTPESFRMLATISTVGELWGVVDGIKSIDNILLEHLYFMRKGVNPVWEDRRNRLGGCWSIKVDLKDSFTILVKILAFVMGENSMKAEDETNLSEHVTGVSFCSKNSFNAIIQIWNDDKFLNKITLLHPEISEPFMADIIYRPHIPEYNL